MSNLTVQRLGEESQRDNDPHRLDYIRRDQVNIDRVPSQTIQPLHVAWVGACVGGMGLLAAVLTGIWSIFACWRVSEFAPTTDCTWSIWALRASMSAMPIGLFIVVIVAPFVAMYGYIIRARARAMRERMTRDRWSNPVDARAVINKSMDEYWREWQLAAQAEIAMAPYKQLPAGLDSLSNSQHYNKTDGAEQAGADDNQEMPFDEFWSILTEDVVHLKAIGPSKSGKSYLCQALLNHIVKSKRDQVVVMSPVGANDDWSVPVIGLTDINKITEALDVLIDEGDRRQRELASGARAQFDLDNNHIWIFVDETPEVAQNSVTKDKWVEFFSRFGSRARHMHMHVVIMAQTETVMSLGTKGNAAIKENLTTVYTKKISGRHIVEIVHGEDSITREPVVNRVADTYRIKLLAEERPALRDDSVFLDESSLVRPSSSTQTGRNPYPSNGRTTRATKVDALVQLILLGEDRDSIRDMGVKFSNDDYTDANAIADRLKAS